MAKCTVNAGGEWAQKLAQLGAETDRVAAQAVAKGAGVLADQIRHNLEDLSEDFQPDPAKPYHYLVGNEKYTGIPAYQKDDLLDSLGITPVQVDKDGDYNAKIGFDGYGSQPTASYPHGLPNPLAARATESGSSVRPKQPFIRPAVKSARQRAVDAIAAVIDAAVEKTMNR